MSGSNLREVKILMLEDISMTALATKKKLEEIVIYCGPEETPYIILRTKVLWAPTTSRARELYAEHPDTFLCMIDVNMIEDEGEEPSPEPTYRFLDHLDACQSKMEKLAWSAGHNHLIVPARVKYASYFKSTNDIEDLKRQVTGIIVSHLVIKPSKKGFLNVNPEISLP